MLLNFFYCDIVLLLLLDKNMLALLAGIIGVLLNIVLSLALAPFATGAEKKPIGGAHNLSYKSQIMHMMVHHKQTMLTSSAIILVVVALSVWIAECVEKKMMNTFGLK